LVNAACSFSISGKPNIREVSGFSPKVLLAAMTETSKEALRIRKVNCPKCKSQFLFRRARTPHFDAQGFESYKLKCKFCRSSLAGVIDPFDGALLLSVMPQDGGSD
jgi:hypothetical protein